MAPMTPRLKILSGSSHPRLSLSQTFSALFNISPFSLPHLFLVAHPARFFPLHDARAVLASLRLPACRVTTPPFPLAFCTALHCLHCLQPVRRLHPRHPNPCVPLTAFQAPSFPFIALCPSSSPVHPRFSPFQPSTNATSFAAAQPSIMDDELMQICSVGGNPVSAFLSWRLQATNACDVTLVWKSGYEHVSQYGISFK